MPKVEYPPKPQGTQYPGWFPHIETSGGPTESGESEIKQVFLTIHPLPDQEDAPKESNVLGKPSRLDFGVLDLWLEAGTKRSESHRAAFDLAKAGIEAPPPPDPAPEATFHFLPGKDDANVRVKWQLYGRGQIRSAKLELFARGIEAPVWQRQWGGAFGRKDAELSAFPLTDGRITSEGELALSEIKPSREAKRKDAEGNETLAFPKGVLTLAGSPYQLRLTVSGQETPGHPEDGDKFAFPKVAWTYLLVRLKKLEIGAGPKAWLDDRRPDVDEKYRAKTLLREQGIADALARETLGEGSVTPIRVLSNVGALTPASDDFGLHQKLWGNGPRIPLTATPVLLDVNGEEVREGIADVVAGAEVLWDWTDDHPERWKEGLDPGLEFDTKKTKEFLELLHKKFSSKYEPKGSCNCPVEYGGKYGDAAAPVFPPQDGTGAAPFTVKPLATREWAVRSTIDPATGKAGVIFQPSRMAGDRYDVAAYLYDDPLDTKEKLETAPEMKGDAGTFEVLRERTLHHVKLGHIDNIDLDEMRTRAVAYARKQLATHLDFRNVDMPDPKYQEIMGRAAKSYRESTAPCGGMYPRPLIFEHAWNPAAPVGTSAIVLRSRKDLVKQLEKVFLECDVIRVKRTPALGIPTPAGDGAMQYQTWVAGDGTRVIHSEPMGDPNLPGQYYAIAEKGKRVPLDTPLRATIDKTHQENYDVKAITYKAMGGDRSVAATEIHFTKDDSKKSTVVVKFPYGEPHTIKYTKKTLTRRLRRNMTRAEKDRLREAFKAAAAQQVKPEKIMSIEIIGRNDSTNSQGRIDRLRRVLESFIRDEHLIHDKSVAFEHFKRNTLNGWMEGGRSTWRDLSYKSAYSNILPLVIDEVRKENPSIEEGILVGHVQRATNLTDLAADRDIHYAEAQNNPNADKADHKYYDMPLGASDPNYEAQNPFLRLLNFGTPDPTSPKTQPAGDSKAPLAVFLHEVAHAMGFGHSPYPAGFTGPAASGPKPEQHLAGEGCIMDYHPRTNEFCGICRVRARGWNWPQIPNEVGQLKAEVAVSVGTIGNIFDEPATTDHGLAQRLQAMGLYNRPIDFEPEDERRAAFELAKIHAKKVLGLDDLAAGVDAKVREFILEKGALPKSGTFARLRLPAGWTPLYSIGDKMHEYPAHEPTDPPNRMDYWSIQAERHRVERDIVSANDALGAIPIHIDVKQVVGKSTPAPWEGARVFIQLVPPDKLAPATEEKDGVKVCGATSFLKGYDVPAGAAASAVSYRKTKIDDHQKAPEGDPQAANVHHTLGGKRGLVPNVISVSAHGMRNLFTDLEWNDLPPNGYPDGTVDAPKARPNTVCVLADEAGCVDVVFWPSLIAGDRYKLKIYVEAPDKENEIVGEPFVTGTMVRWRTVRLSSYIQVPAPASAAEVPDWIRDVAHKRQRHIGGPLEDFVALADVDLSGTVSQHLARSYNELLVEEAALKPRALTAGDWTKVLAQWKRYVETYPDLANNTAAAKQSPLVDPLVPDEARKVYTVRLRSSTPVPGTVQVRLAGGQMNTSAGHDWLPPEAEERAVVSNIVAIETGEPVCGREDRKRTGPKVPLVGSVDYTTGEVRIDFEQAQPATAQWTIVYHAQNYLDLDALLPAPNEMPDKSLFLLPLNGPDTYNAKKRPGSPAMPAVNEAADSPPQAGFINAAGWGTANVLMGCLARAIEGNGQSLLPGIILVQSALQDPYGFLWSVTQEGKGWGNVLFLYSPKKEADAEKFKRSVARLAAHELGHCLYLQHAEGNGTTASGKQPAEHDPAERDCMMTYSGAETKQHCGGCQANLRGIRMWDSPLNAKKHAHPSQVAVDDPVDDEHDEQVV